jgi:purine-binding chemotaxis protein CheW
MQDEDSSKRRGARNHGTKPHRHAGSENNGGRRSKTTEASSRVTGTAAETAVEDTVDDLLHFADSLKVDERDELEVDEVSEPWISFRLGGDDYACPVEKVHEVLRVGSITRVPHAPHAVRGITHRRGSVLPVIDLGKRLKRPAVELGAASRILVVSHQGRPLGLLVDAVHQVLQLRPTRVLPPPPELAEKEEAALCGTYQENGHLLLLLDMVQALSPTETTAAQEEARR